jgi:hypothetical protein
MTRRSLFRAAAVAPLVPLVASAVPVAPPAPPAPLVSRRQTFLRGDLVRVNGDPRTRSLLGSEGELAIVVGSYADQFGDHWSCGYEGLCKDPQQHEVYTLRFPKIRTVSWFDAKDLTLVEPRNLERLDILDRAGPVRR